jgi:hypothetical protein
MTIVDVHCHTFNGDDLPAQGFVQRVLLDNLGTLQLVSWVLDNVAQLGSPSYEAERAQLDRLLGYESPGLAALAFAQEPDFDVAVEAAFQQALAAKPSLVLEAERELTSTQRGAPPGADNLALLGGLSAAKRAVAWIVLLRRSRLDITRRLIAAFPEVDLFTPLLVDMAIGLHDTPAVTPMLQIELQEKISRASMLGLLQPGSTARVHPFVGFDPRSEYRSQKAGDVTTAFDVVKKAIAGYGFIGVKLYPPMGFRPIDNVAGPEMTQEEATATDAILDTLYSWCVELDVPITVHCNPSNQALDAYRLFSDPLLWAKVLDKHDGLRLNLGHFGGARAKADPNDPGSSWPSEIAALASHSHLFADTGDHRIHDPTIAAGYLSILEGLFDPSAPTTGMKDRLMYGSDWYMLALLPDWPDFLDDYQKDFTKAFGQVASARFMGGAALDFLGFTDPDNQNRQRLIDRYQKVKAPRPPWLE